MVRTGWLVGLALIAGCTAAWRASLPGEGRATALTLDGAAVRLAEAARRDPILEDYVLYFQASAAAGAGKTADATEHLRHLLERHPDSVWTGSGRLLLGRLLRRSRDLGAARSWLAAARATLPEGSPRWGRASLALAEVAHRLGEDGAAVGPLREVRKRFPRRALARRSRRLADRIRREHPDLIPWDAPDEAEMRLREGDAPGAHAIAVGVLADDTVPETVRGRALWVRAQAERALGDRDGAEATMISLARTMPTHTLAPRALLTAAGWRWNADDDEAALRLFGEVVHRFRDSTQAGDALYGMGRIHQEARRYRDAFGAYRRLAEGLPNHSLAADADWRAGWVRYLGGDFAGAAQWFGRKVRGRPAVRPAAEYWRARSLERSGRANEAAALLEHVATRHRTSYYAERAEERLGRSSAPGQPTIPTPARFPPELSGPHAERARALAAIGLSHFARLEVDALRDANEPRRRDLLEAYTAVGAPSAALGLAREMRPRTPGPFGRYLYPLGFWPVVAQAARRHEVDPFFVLALIRQESLFDPDAVSPADAHGLMQLLPGTARELARTGGVPPPPPAALHRPAVNVVFGVALLRRLLDRYEGSREKALAAYNAGPDAVAKWERRYGSREADEFVELISYRETRDYVKAVLRNYRTYRRLYAESASTTSDGSPPNAPFDMMAITSPGREEATR